MKKEDITTENVLYQIMKTNIEFQFVSNTDS